MPSISQHTGRWVASPATENARRGRKSPALAAACCGGVKATHASTSRCGCRVFDVQGADAVKVICPLYTPAGTLAEGV